MVSRINKLHNAIQGAKVHLSDSVEQHSNHERKNWRIKANLGF